LKGAKKDLEDKLDAIDDTLQKREAEITELKDVLKDKERKGDQLQD